jgi:hypothetical protein
VGCSGDFAGELYLIECLDWSRVRKDGVETICKGTEHDIG